MGLRSARPDRVRTASSKAESSIICSYLVPTFYRWLGGKQQQIQSVCGTVIYK